MHMAISNHCGWTFVQFLVCCQIHAEMYDECGSEVHVRQRAVRPTTSLIHVFNGRVSN